MSRASTWSISMGLAALVAGCGVEAREHERAARETTSQAIFGGQVATTCQFPSTVLLSGCTGTLVHPQIVITAAHCGTGHKIATFGETRTGPRKVAIESCKRIGNGNNAADDYAYCKLVMPVTDVPIAPPLMGCEVDQLKPGRPIIEAGFGDADDDGGGFGRKRWTETVFNKIQRGAANVGGKGKGYCYGDSGGPAFVKLDDGSWRSFGIVSEGLGASCGAGDLIAFMHTAVPWIEKTSGIDITPCHDADGTWHPGPTCRAFAMNLGMEGRTWETGCAEPALSPPSATCGPAYAGPGVDPAPPASDAGTSDGAVMSDAQGSGGASGTGGVSGTGGTTGGKPDAQPEGTGGATSPGSGGAGSPRGTGGTPAPTAPATDGGGHTGGGCSCSMGGPAPVEGGMALLAAVAFALAFILRRRWFPRSAVVDAGTKTHAGAHAD